MSSPVICIECGATSYNDPGKTPIRCASCWEKLQARAEKAEGELAALREAVVVLRDMLKENVGEYAICRADNLPMTTYDHMILSDVQGAINELLPEPPESA